MKRNVLGVWPSLKVKHKSHTKSNESWSIAKQKKEERNARKLKRRQMKAKSQNEPTNKKKRKGE